MKFTINVLLTATSFYILYLFCSSLKDLTLLQIVASIPLLFAMFFISTGIPILGYTWDKKNWNNGICPNCNKGFWKSFDMDSQGGIGYTCTNCGSTHWQSGWYDHKIKIT